MLFCSTSRKTIGTRLMAKSGGIANKTWGLIKDHFGSLDVGQRIRFSHLKQACACRGNKILDAGCNQGAFLLYFASIYPNKQFLGIDFNAAAIDQVNIKISLLGLQNVRATEGNLLAAIPIKIDYFYCIDVLEHIDRDDQVLSNLYEALRAGGGGVLHVPLWPQKRFFTRYVRQHDHVRDGYHLPDLLTMLSKIGFKVKSQRFTFGVCGLLAWEIQSSLKTIFPAFLARLISLPTTIVGAFVDTHFTSKTGNGALIEVVKE